VKRYRFLEEADAEFQQDIRYFDEQVTGLGDKFIADVEHVLTQIREYPESGRRVSRNLRKRVLRVFKHNILYVNAPDEIIVVAVAAHRRKPGYWRGRLRKLR
jgi:plasmid stabilization system protein ParE